jgi:hypothetical protein
LTLSISEIASEPFFHAETQRVVIGRDDLMGLPQLFKNRFYLVPVFTRRSDALVSALAWEGIPTGRRTCSHDLPWHRVANDIG